MKRIAALLILSVFLLPVVAYSQDFDAQFNAFEQQNRKSFQNFSDSINKAFAEAMVANMRVFKGEPAKIKDPKPKPVTPPAVKPEKVPQDLPHQDPIKEEPVQEEPVNGEPKLDRPNPVEDSPTPTTPFGAKSLDFNLFGRNISWMTPPITAQLQSIEPSDVSNFWIQLSEWDYKTLVDICDNKRKEDYFNDWAICQLVFQMARHIFPKQYNEQVVFSVFMMNQLGLDAKVGFAPSHLFCMIAINQQIYGVNFTETQDKNYFFFNLNPNIEESDESFFFRSYNHYLSSSIRPLDMRILNPLKADKAGSIRDKDRQICIDIHQIELFSTYPQVDIDIYANAKPSEAFCQSVKQTLSPKLRGLSSFEAVSFLLSYVHFSFEYATDEEQFGYEKPFFCEESYYFPKNDCEDRSVLFSFLVRYLLNMDVVLIDYPGHIATAVHFDQDVKGENFTYRGKKYVVCDPTYIGASVGMEMPGCTSVDRTIVPLEAVCF